MNVTSSAVALVNPSYAQAPYVHPQTAGKPLEPPYQQNSHQQPLVAADQPSSQPQATADHYLSPEIAPPSLTVQTADNTHLSHSVLQYPPQYSLRSNQVSNVVAPSFPYFTQDDPRQFASLKTALTNFLPHDESEQFKYPASLDHLDHLSSTSLKQSYVSLTAEVWPATATGPEGNYSHPYPPSVHPGDSKGFSDFAIQV